MPPATQCAGDEQDIESSRERVVSATRHVAPPVFRAIEEATGGPADADRQAPGRRGARRVEAPDARGERLGRPPRPSRVAGRERERALARPGGRGPDGDAALRRAAGHGGDLEDAGICAKWLGAKPGGREAKRQRVAVPRLADQYASRRRAARRVVDRPGSRRRAPLPGRPAVGRREDHAAAVADARGHARRGRQALDVRGLGTAGERVARPRRAAVGGREHRAPGRRVDSRLADRRRDAPQSVHLGGRGRHRLGRPRHAAVERARRDDRGGAVAVEDRRHGLAVEGA